MLSNVFRKKTSDEKGSITLEFLGVLPYFLMFFLLLWQAVASGYAVMTAQSAINEAAKVYAITESQSEANQVASQIVDNSVMSTSNVSIQRQANGVFTATVSVSHALVFVPEQWRNQFAISFDHSATGKVLP